MLRRLAFVMLWASVAGCWASVVDGAPDASPVDMPRAEVATVDLPPADAPGRDGAQEGGAPQDGGACDPAWVGDAEPSGDVPLVPSDAPYVVQLAVNDQLHQCARMSNGTLRCRGFNASGQLGLGTTEEISGVREVPGLADVEQVVTSYGTTCTRHRDGSVRCWGDNSFEVLGTAPEANESCGGRSCRTRPVLLPEVTEVTHLSAADFSTCAVRRDGSLWCWGDVGFPYPLREARRPTAVPMEANVVWVQALLLG